MNTKNSAKISRKVRWINRRIEKILDVELLSKEAQAKLKKRVDGFFMNTGANSFQLEFGGPFGRSRIVVEWKRNQIDIKSPDAKSLVSGQVGRL
jgi:hypothetical protein